MQSGTPSPIDLPEPELEEGGLGWTFGVIFIASLFLLLTNAGALRDWIDDQPPSPVQAQAAEFADQWVEITEGFGIAVPHDFMHAQWKRAEEARFQADDRQNGEGATAPTDQR